MKLVVPYCETVIGSGARNTRGVFIKHFVSTRPVYTEFNINQHDAVFKNHVAYCVVAKESVRQHISNALLERIRSDFMEKYKAGKADTAVAKSLSKEFGLLMKEQMKYVTYHAEEIDKLLKVQAQVIQVKNIMWENIDKTTKRGEAIDDLSNKAEDLHDNAQVFKKRGEQIKRKMWYQNMKIKLVVLGILVLLAFIFWLSICRGFNCSK